MSTRQILKNTGFLYIRMLLITIVALYTSRVTIELLGIKDYGVYILVGGFVALFVSFANMMTGATQRFLNYSIGRNDKQQIIKVFSTAMYIHLLFAISFIVIGETFGLWFVSHRLSIPDDSRLAALITYQFALASMALSITQVPYNAVIIAYEKMQIYSVIGIVEVCLKLALTFVLITLKNDILIIYSILMFLSSLTIRAIYFIYVRRCFPFIRVKMIKDRYLLKEMTTFASWSLLGTVSYVSINQAIPIILNMFFGVVVNAAMGIANQVSGTVNQFVSNFQVAFKPQIVKLYAQGEVYSMLNLVTKASKMSFCLFLLILIPIYPILETILQIWLTSVPEYTTIFCKLVLMYCLVDTLTIPIWTAIEATGRVKTYQLFVGIFFIMYIPISYWLLKMGFSAPTILGLKIIMSVFIHIGRLRILKLNIPEFSYRAYVFEVIIPLFLTLIIPVIAIILLSSFHEVYFTAIIGFVTVCISILLFGLKGEERQYIFQLIKNNIIKLKCNQ